MTFTHFDHTVLIIDDEDFILSSLNRLLRQEFNVLLANSGQEGLELMKKHEVHVVVTDQRMPGMTGVDFLSLVKGEHPDAIRMLLTGYSDLESVIAAVNSGNIYRYLVKPWNPGEFISIVREACFKYDLIVQNRQLTNELIAANTDLEERVKDRTARLARNNSLAMNLNQIAITLQSSLDLDQVNQTLEAGLMKLRMNCSIVLREIQPSGLSESSLLDGQLAAHFIHSDAFVEVSMLKKIFADERAPEFVEDLRVWFDQMKTRFADQIPTAFEQFGNIPGKVYGAILPLRARQGMIGMMILWGSDFQEDDIPTLTMFANQVAVVIENVEYFATLKKLAETDALTGLFNRHYILEMADREFRRAKRLHDDMSVIMIDVDRFKQINDTFGHAVGDQVLKFIADNLKEALRKDVDLVGRYGGDEFVVLLPETDPKGAGGVANRLQKYFETREVPINPGPDQVFISVGMAELTDTVESLDELLDIADQKMYAFKNKRKLDGSY